MSTALKHKLYIIIFGTDTPAGKLFDVVLIYTILLSVLVLVLDSIESVASQFGSLLLAAEWFFTIVFTIEYGLRIYCSPAIWCRYCRPTSASFFRVQIIFWLFVYCGCCASSES